MTNPRLILIILFVVLVTAFFAFDLQSYFTLANLKAQQQAISDYHNAHPLQTIGMYSLIYIAITGLSLPGATVLTLAGGAIFGLFWGTLIVSFSSSIGATLAFLSARFLFRETVQNRFTETLKAIDAGVARDGAFYLFSLRIVPLFPFFVINLAMGLTNLKTLTFYWVSQIGMFAGTLVYVNAGTQLAKIETLSGILSPILVMSFALLGFFPILAKKLIENFPQRRD